LIDYDDTILPTTYLDENGVSLKTYIRPDSELARHLADLDTVAEKLLLITISHGEVMILTNATKSWVLESSAKFLPKTHRLILTIMVASARDEYSEIYEDASEWKKNYIVSNIPDIHLYTYIVNIGDSEYEREAVLHLKSLFPETVKVKSLRLDADTTSVIKTRNMLHYLNGVLSPVLRDPQEIDCSFLFHSVSVATPVKFSSKGLPSPRPR
jgi:hypothetical protein